MTTAQYLASPRSRSHHGHQFYQFMTGNWDGDNASHSEVLPIVRGNARSHPASLGLWNIRLGTLVIDIDDLTVLYLRLSLINVLTAVRPDIKALTVGNAPTGSVVLR
ncbi:hypothetical protein LTR17_000093 [Elasticomyces elasticus]|nr:hypothetical protein LTR17_000093 [Elasticomyces elasticus]